MFFLFLFACADVTIEEGVWCAQSVAIDEACEASYCVGPYGPILEVFNGQSDTWLPCQDKDCSEEWETALWVCE